jgi:hypothetical protein
MSETKTGERIKLQLADHMTLQRTSTCAASVLRSSMQLCDAIEKIAADAERYQWLREGFRMMAPNAAGEHAWVPRAAALGNLRGPSLDDAIDAARTTKPEA